jgi:hypothetical protein
MSVVGSVANLHSPSNKVVELVLALNKLAPVLMVKAALEFAEFDVPFATKILLAVVGEIDVNPAPWAPCAPCGPGPPVAP